MRSCRTFGWLRSNAPASPLDGAWRVDELGAVRWKHIVLRAGSAAAYGDDDGRDLYTAYVNAEAHELTLPPRTNSPAAALRWSQPDPQHVLLEGTLGGQPPRAPLSLLDAGKTRLMNRGFHWISEAPFNR